MMNTHAIGHGRSGLFLRNTRNGVDVWLQPDANEADGGEHDDGGQDEERDDNDDAHSLASVNANVVLDLQLAFGDNFGEGVHLDPNVVGAWDRQNDQQADQDEDMAGDDESPPALHANDVLHVLDALDDAPFLA